MVELTKTFIVSVAAPCCRYLIPPQRVFLMFRLCLILTFLSTLCGIWFGTMISQPAHKATLSSMAIQARTPIYPILSCEHWPTPFDPQDAIGPFLIQGDRIQWPGRDGKQYWCSLSDVGLFFLNIHSPYLLHTVPRTGNYSDALRLLIQAREEYPELQSKFLADNILLLKQNQKEAFVVIFGHGDWDKQERISIIKKGHPAKTTYQLEEIKLHPQYRRIPPPPPIDERGLASTTIAYFAMVEHPISSNDGFHHSGWRK